jgi:pyruvate,water dikinase
MDNNDVPEVGGKNASLGEKQAFFVDTLARGIGSIAASCHPRPVILRMSDPYSGQPFAGHGRHAGTG